MRIVHVCLDSVTEFQSVHHRHHHVADYQIHVMVFHDVESLFSVAGCENFIIIVEATFEEMTRVKVVFDYKDG